jgi:hypothetical protein
MMVGNPAMIGTAMMYTAGFAFSGNKNVYYYGSDADALTKLEKKQFIEVMSKLMADKPEVVVKIQDKTFKYGKLKSCLTIIKPVSYPEKIPVKPMMPINYCHL